jgi:hypothetical protein
MIRNGMYTLRNVTPDGWRTVSCERAFERLEPDDGKLSRPVLRGLEGSNALRLPGMLNNPINNIDPSGHKTCDSDGYCGSYDPPTHYEINISDDFTAEEKAEIMAAILMISAKLGGWRVFNSVFGGTIFIRDTTLGSWGGITSVIGVRLNPSLLTEYVVTHEMGHVFQGLVYAVDYDNSPANQLAKASNVIVDDDGEIVSGLDNGTYRRTDMVYQTCPGGKGCQFEEHPTSIDINAVPPVDPDNANEDVADMFLNWVYDSFNYDARANGAGTARYEWWNSRMSGWIGTIN